MPDKWAQYAQPAAASDKWAQYAQPASEPAKPEPQGFFSSAADSSGLTGLTHAIAHPIDTVMGLPGAIKGAVTGAVKDAHDEVDALRNNGLTQETRRKIGGDIPIIGPTLAKAQSQHDAGNDAGMAGTLAGTVAGLAAPSAIKPGIPLVGGALESTGEGMQGAGVGLINKTVGALKNDFKRGANPGRGYFEAGNGPAISMQSLADRGAASKAAVGTKIGNVIDSSKATIPTEDVHGAIQTPLAKGVALETGPGGLGNTDTIEKYAEGFKPALQEAVANGGFTPREVFDLKRGIAQNTNWSDPSQFNLKAIRQGQVGALSGVLSDTIPELGPLNSQYGDLNKFAARATTRAETHSSPLTTLAGKLGGGLLGAGLGAEHGLPGILAGTGLGLALDSVPVKTAAASGLFYGGKGIARAGSAIKSLVEP